MEHLYYSDLQGEHRGWTKDCPNQPTKSFHVQPSSLSAKSNILWETELPSVVIGCPYLIMLKATELVLFWIKDE